MTLYEDEAVMVLDKPPGSLPDVAFYLRRLSGLDGPILEPAVGSGRMLIPLLEAGHDAEGIMPVVNGVQATPDQTLADGDQVELLVSIQGG